ncbi:hypothetical protein DPEC_G00219570 [Dallia pectoralis]|uniref:Uncharacterized protein n=1 Tax=Dallia pectoralis TaxID=75939 RepID=A0ACC2G3M5_DALPE|nr:hypothetical protein DPEC_G00219570 [Dallia pectoralis]
MAAGDDVRNSTSESLWREEVDIRTEEIWSRLKVDICDVPDALGEGSPALKQRCFQNINECIEASREKRERVLVHCRDWFSLAPTCIIQYLMVKQNMQLIAAYEVLRTKYPVNTWRELCDPEATWTQSASSRPSQGT